MKFAHNAQILRYITILKQALKAQLITQIERAFEDVEYPGDGAFFGNDDTEELIGKHWKDVPLEILRSEDRFLHLRQDALRFYMPAYLINIITHPSEMDVLVDDIIYFLAPSSKLSWKTKPISYLPNFAPKERAAIRAFIEAFRQLFPDIAWDDYPPHREALERAIAYWQYYG